MFFIFNSFLIFVYFFESNGVESKGTEMCELGCEESELDLFLNECRNACAVRKSSKIKNKMDEYMKCLYKTCVQKGVGPNDDIYLDDLWLKCADECERDELLAAHEATEKPLFHTQYLSDKQYENFKIIQKIETNVKQNKTIKRKSKQNLKSLQSVHKVVNKKKRN